MSALLILESAWATVVLASIVAACLTAGGEEQET